MNIADCLEIGKIVKVHGLKGELVIHLDSENPDQYLELESVFVEIKQKLVPFFIEEIRTAQAKKVVVRFEDVDDLTKAQAIINSRVFLPREVVEELDADKFIYSDLIGYTMEDANAGVIGVIEEIYQMPGNDLFGVMKGEEEILIPVNDQFVVEIDDEKELVKVNLPGGLLELNEPGKSEEEDDGDEN